MSRMKVRDLTAAGLLAALALSLSFLEGLLPPLPIPGARLGLANVTVMFALTCVSARCAAVLTVVKALFALFRGVTAAVMSGVGGAAALLGMWLMRRLLGDRLGTVGLGIVGAVMHNAGQWLVAYALFGEAMWYYAPLLLILALPAGGITGITLHITTPYLKRLPFDR